MANVKRPFQARQGDIFFRAVDQLPMGKLTAKFPHDAVFAYGEVTGHCHKAISPKLSELDMVSDENGNIYVLSKKEKIKVWHDEHSVVTLPKNKWICISRQREYDPLAQSKQRMVLD